MSSSSEGARLEEDGGRGCGCAVAVGGSFFLVVGGGGKGESGDGGGGGEIAVPPPTGRLNDLQDVNDLTNQNQLYCVVIYRVP